MIGRFHRAPRSPLHQWMLVATIKHLVHHQQYLHKYPKASYCGLPDNRCFLRIRFLILESGKGWSSNDVYCVMSVPFVETESNSRVICAPKSFTPYRCQLFSPTLLIEKVILPSVHSPPKIFWLGTPKDTKQIGAKYNKKCIHIIPHL